jgi:hypothetical protein
MPTQLTAYANENGGKFQLNNSVFSLGTLFSHSGVVYGKVRAEHGAEYELDRHSDARVDGYDGAEVWIISTRRNLEIGHFAIHEGQLIQLQASLRPWLSKCEWVFKPLLLSQIRKPLKKPRTAR